MRAFLISASIAALLAGSAHARDAQAGAGAVLDANKAASGAAALEGKGTLKVEFAYAGNGMTGQTASVYDVASGDFIDSYVIGPAKGANGYDGRTPWMKEASGAVTPQGGGDTRQLAVNEAYRDANLWWRPDRGGATVTSLGVKTDGAQRYDAVSVTPVGGKPFEAWFDADTHLLARTIEAQGWQTITVYISDYRPVEGVQLPGKEMIDDGSGPQYRQSMTLTSAAFTPAQPASAYAAPPMVVAGARIDNPSGRTTVPFKLLNNHIYADVMVNGKGPFLTIFDTGGNDLLTPEAAKALAVKAEGAAPGSGAGEGTVDVGITGAVTFKIGDLTITDPTIAVLPFEAPQVEGFSEQAMIGFEVFRRFVTRFDYGARTITFIDPAKFDPKDAGTPVPFQFYSHIPQAEGTFEGVPGKFDIDTGSRVELTLTGPFVADHGLMASHPKGVNGVDGWGVGGPSRSYIARGGYLTLGPVRLDNVVAGFSTDKKGAFADPNYAGNVGSALLKAFVVTFDYDHQIMYLKPIAKTDPDVGTFDRAGFWINTSPTGFKIVDLTAGGAAQAAGLKVGDEITAIDGAPASSIAITDMRQRFRDGAAGTRMELKVLTAGAARPVTLVLKDQI